MDESARKVGNGSVDTPLLSNPTEKAPNHLPPINPIKLTPILFTKEIIDEFDCDITSSQSYCSNGSCASN